MAREVICPVCDASIPLEPRDKDGDNVYCSFCSAALKLQKERSDNEDTSKFKAVQDYG